MSAVVRPDESAVASNGCSFATTASHSRFWSSFGSRAVIWAGLRHGNVETVVVVETVPVDATVVAVTAAPALRVQRNAFPDLAHE
jgi:hypothetical protein